MLTRINVGPSTLTMKAILCLSFLTTVFGFQFGWSSFLEDDVDSWNMDRRSSCVGQSGKCFSSGQCCKGFVCAAFDDLFGKKPEIPGYCVREKDLQKCNSNIDCDEESECAPLGRKKILYCINKNEVREQHMGRYSDGGKEGLKGAECQDNNDCAYKDKRNKLLCCQEVRKYRQKAKRICDVITPVSVCIAKRR